MNYSKSYCAAVFTGISLFLAGCGGSGNTTQSSTPKSTAKEIMNAKIVQGSANPAVIAISSTNLGVLKEALKTLPLETNSRGIKDKTTFNSADMIPPGIASGKVITKSIGSSIQTFSVDSLGRLAKQSIFGSYSAQYTYQGDSQVVTTAIYTDHDKYSYSYNNDQITSYATGGFVINICYVGTERTETLDKVSVTYDANNKIVSLTDGKNSARINRTYDANGNQTKIEVFYTEGLGIETLQAVNESSYGANGIISSTTTLYDRAIPEYDFVSVTETTVYDVKGNRSEENYVWKDESGTTLLTDTEIYSGYTYDPEDLTRVSEYTALHSGSTTFKLLKLVSGKNNQ